MNTITYFDKGGTGFCNVFRMYNNLENADIQDLISQGYEDVKLTHYKEEYMYEGNLVD